MKVYGFNYCIQLNSIEKSLFVELKKIAFYFTLRLRLIKLDPKLYLSNENNTA